MASLFQDIFTISPAKTGDAILKRLSLSGWSLDESISAQGKLYWALVDDTLTFYSDKEMQQAVCSGEVDDDNTVLLESDSIDELSGEAVIEYTEDSTGFVILSYCNEQDLVSFERDVLEQLDEDDEFQGMPRFEQPMMKAKEYIDAILRERLRPRFKATGEVDLSFIAKPRQLATATALYALHLIYFSLGHGDEALERIAKAYEAKANKMLELTEIDLDFEDDGTVDGSDNTRGIRFER